MKTEYKTTTLVHHFDGRNKCKMTVENWPAPEAWASLFGPKAGEVLDRCAQYGFGIRYTQKERNAGIPEVTLDLQKVEPIKGRGGDITKKPAGALSVEQLMALIAAKQAEAKE